jgi:cytochrome c
MWQLQDSGGKFCTGSFGKGPFIMRFIGLSIAILGLIAASAAVLPRAANSAAPAPTSAARGKILFLRCAACHAVSLGAPAKIGPNLNGIVGKASGAVPRFNYSPAMRAARLRWDDATLDRWLTRPASVVPGTSMVFAGLPSADDRKAVIAFLKKPVS